MLPLRKISAKHYYDYLPDAALRCGDIWSGLPAHGLLGLSPVRALVITPACDLANRKAETVVYLPVLPIRAYFSTAGALPDVQSRISGLLRAGRFPSPPDWERGGYLPPTIDAIDRVQELIIAHLTTRQRGKSEIESLDRAVAGLRVLRSIANPEVAPVEDDVLQKFYAREWPKLKSDLIMNGYRTDLHFLPRDEQEGGFSGLAAHSVVLFRYPMTAPVELFTLAQETTEAAWQDQCSTVAATYPAASAFKYHRPVKVLGLRGEFLADLLSRYCAVYSRIGSPDFTPQSVNQLSEEVDA